MPSKDYKHAVELVFLQPARGGIAMMLFGLLIDGGQGRTGRVLVLSASCKYLRISVPRATSWISILVERLAVGYFVAGE
jgi:hypothetical protein